MLQEKNLVSNNWKHSKNVSEAVIKIEIRKVTFICLIETVEYCFYIETNILLYFV